MSDPVNSSDEVMQMAWQAVIDAASKGQIYELAIDDELDEFAEAVRAEAVADERRRAVAQVRHDMALLADLVEDYTLEGARIRLRSYATQLERSLAAGSVPVATPPSV